MTFKECKIPKEVFHYTKAHTAIEKILFEKKIRLSQFESMNDPKESKNFYPMVGMGNAPLPVEKWHQDFTEYYNAHKGNKKSRDLVFTEYRTEIASTIKGKEWKVLSVSKHHPSREKTNDNPFFDGYGRPRMWAQYADNHEGVCLKFNGEKLDKQIRLELEPKGKVYCGDIFYNDEMLLSLKSQPPFNSTNMRSLSTSQHRRRFRDYFKKNYEKLFLLKSEDWQGEYEFRWLFNSKRDSVEYISIDGVLEEVVLGLNFPTPYLPSICAICKSLNVEVKKLRPFEGILDVSPFECD